MLSLGGPTFKKQTKKQTKKNNNTKTLFNLALVRVKFDFVNTKMEKIVYRPRYFDVTFPFPFVCFCKAINKKIQNKNWFIFSSLSEGKQQILHSHLK